MTVLGGDIIYAADLNDLIALTSAKPLVRLTQQSGQSLTSGSPTALTFGSGSEEIDTHNFHDTSSNNTRVTPTVAGYYRVTVSIAMAVGASAYSQLVATVAKNGTRLAGAQVMRPASSTAGNGAAHTAIVQCNGTTDYVEGWAQQTASGANSTNASTPFSSTLEVEFLRS